MMHPGNSRIDAPTVALWAWVASGVLMLLALLRPLTPHQPLGVRSFKTPEITASTSFAQTFLMPVGGLDEIRLHPVLTSRPAGRINVSLVDITQSEAGEHLMTQTVAAADFGGVRGFRFGFDPIADSQRRQYRVLITTDADRTGVALRATKGDGYRGGALEVNGKVRWADLAFATSAPVRSQLALLWYGTPTRSPTSGRLAVCALGLMWIAAGSILRGVARAGA